ncbi:MAG: hypothetical protein J5J06_07265 [Phycisphaerae bacterium]|nr:hypothetical protein [Phycisphaerae bacterium]
MALKNEQRRRGLFQEMSANLARLRPNLAGTYICPLCMRGGFTEADVVAPSPRLTEEHCIPDGLGPATAVLTCATCNNTAGANIDGELHKRVEFDAFCRAEQRNAFNARLTSDDQNMGIEITRTGGEKPHIDIRIIAKQSNEKDVQKYKDAMKAWVEQRITPNPIRLHFEGNVLPRERLAHVALLKAGYLLLFKRLGYYPIMLPIFETVRSQIRNFDAEELNVRSLVLRMPLDNLPDTICHIQASGAQGVAVPIPLTKYDIGYFVVMPVNGGTYSQWADLYGRNQEAGSENFDCTLHPLDPYELRERFLQQVSRQGPPKLSE